MANLMDCLATALAERYAIERELGAGGMATVYLAEDLKHHRKVAVKVLRPELAAALGPERFLREIEIAANLTHPHILPLHDSGEAAGFLYYVMPYIEGESLRDRLVREKQLAVDDAIEITKQVARALGYAHDRNVVHRDIKPENILLAGGEAVVADFGIAKAIQAAGGESLTETGMAIGTPWYMSPEQATGSQEVDGRTDVYALGCMLYESLGGEPPYTGSTPQAIVARKLAEPVPSLRVLRETVSPAVEEVIFQSLAKAPVDRFTTATQFADALAQAVSGDWSPAGERVHSGTVPASGNRVRLATVVTTVAVLAALGGGAWLASKALASGGADDESLRTIAVLPFENLSPGGERDYVARGVTEEISNQLSKIGTLRLMSSTAVERLLQGGKSFGEMTAELGVGRVLEGSVRQDADKIRVTAQLIDAATNEQIWSGEYDRTVNDLFTVQGQIALEIAGALEATLTPDEARRLSAAPTTNPAAYQLYLRSIEQASTRNAEGNRTTIELLIAALALDSTYADAYARLSWLLTWQHRNTGDRRWLDSALAVAEKVLALDGELSVAHLAMAEAFTGQGRLSQARRSFLRAIELDPNNLLAMNDLSVVETGMGRYDEGLYWAMRAAALPGVTGNTLFHVWYPLSYLGDDSKTGRWITTAQTLFPQNGRLVVANVFHDLYGGREESAAARMSQLLASFPNNDELNVIGIEIGLVTTMPQTGASLQRKYRQAPDALTRGWHRSIRTIYGYWLWRSGQRDTAEVVFDEALRLKQQDLDDGSERWGDPYEIASISAIRGRVDDALEWLERARELGLKFPTIVTLDPMLESLRGDARFQELVARMVSEQETMRRRAPDADTLLARLAGPTMEVVTN